MPHIWPHRANLGALNAAPKARQKKLSPEQKEAEEANQEAAWEAEILHRYRGKTSGRRRKEVEIAKPLETLTSAQ